MLEDLAKPFLPEMVQAELVGAPHRKRQIRNLRSMKG
jgi:hypothetical protein